jgi:hypothetical protein
MRDPDAATGGKWRGWVSEPRPDGNGNRVTHDGNGFVHATKAAAVRAIKAQHVSSGRDGGAA